MYSIFRAFSRRLKICSNNLVKCKLIIQIELSWQIEIEILRLHFFEGVDGRYRLTAVFRLIEQDSEVDLSVFTIIIGVLIFLYNTTFHIMTESFMYAKLKVPMNLKTFMGNSNSTLYNSQLKKITNITFLDKILLYFIQDTIYLFFVWSWNSIQLVIKMYLFNQRDKLYANDSWRLFVFFTFVKK